MNTKGGRYYSALNAASWRHNPDIVTMLLSQGADFSAKDCFGRTALHYATYGNENLETIKLLCAKGANIDARTTARLLFIWQL